MLSVHIVCPLPISPLNKSHLTMSLRVHLQLTMRSCTKVTVYIEVSPDGQDLLDDDGNRKFYYEVQSGRTITDSEYKSVYRMVYWL